MIEMNLKFSLPLPWKNQTFRTTQVGPINFLVGPNGSGKSQFANNLVNQLENSRLLGTDRLSGMEQVQSFRYSQGVRFKNGFDKDQFQNLKQAGKEGSGIDSIVLLQERKDLLIQVEATLRHLFDREITLDWDSGRLVPKVRHRRGGATYRLDQQECHGIKELLVLLTHLYDDKHQYLIIDEPELNLHPQYQAFFMQEVHKFAGDSKIDRKKKIIFLITHSPFILDFRSEDDLNAVISFSLDYSVPKQISKLNIDISSKSFSLMQRLNAHHKQLFFSDNPIFVEGIRDAWIVEAMMAARGVSVAAAGSCVIEAGGNEEVNHYLKLCMGLGKNAHFLYDLDSLFRGSLRACIKDDQSVQNFLATAGLGSDFGEYFKQLKEVLKDLIDRVLSECLPDQHQLFPLSDFLKKLGERKQWKREQWAKARIAVMTAISRHKEEIISVLGEGDVKDVEGRLGRIVAALKEKNIHLLPGGTIERYLPHYTGNEYELAEESKQKAVLAEMEGMLNLTKDEALSARFGKLYDVVCCLPSQPNVDVESVLRNHLSDYIHELQKMVRNNSDWNQDEIQTHLNTVRASDVKVFSIQDFKPNEREKFSATIEIVEMLGRGKGLIHVTDKTNAGMGDFEITWDEPVHESTL